ncbi:MAG: KilA-N domain-containing protein [Anaeroplasma bactoclasticum]|nr:KilA-N domain-containing protein [Anaeroplasma bactoclasticum]MCM1556638.1 KilA-N domain-containing protein [Anaeroplasma bactoclasticum]
MKSITIKEKVINITGTGDDDYVSLTDIARIKNAKEPKDVVKNWMRLRATLEFLGLWETINNDKFKRVEFDPLLQESGRNSFTMSPTRWINEVKAIGIRVKPTKNGGTFAHKDIALEFASWISPEIKLYIIKEFQRLKLQETEQFEWQGKRLLTKINYLIHTDAIKENLILVNLTPEQVNYIYASEADMLNVALFGIKAKEWRELNPNKEGNIRDYASTIELAILSNLEYHNSLLIKENISQKDRLIILNKEANRQKKLFNDNNVKAIKRIENE